MHEVNYLELEQGSPEWLEARLGKISASRAGDLLATVRYGEAAGYRNYKTELAVERITGKRAERFVTNAMQYGTDTEAVAATMYQLQTGNLATICGAFEIDGTNVLASPDRLVGDDGLVEIKCRELGNHVESMLADKIPDLYYKQIQFQLWVTHRQWCDYVSYGDEMPENAQLFIKRVERDDEVINEIIERVEQIEDDISKLIEAVNGYGKTNSIQVK